MTETIEYEQFEQAGPAGVSLAGDGDLSRLSDIPMELSVEIGRTHMTVGETLDLRVGSVVALERLSGETADLLVNGTAIARGEVVVIDEQYGLRITEILDRESDPELAEPSAASAPEEMTAEAAVEAKDEADGGGETSEPEQEDEAAAADEG